MRISDWSSDVCSSDLLAKGGDILGRDVAIDLIAEIKVAGQVHDQLALHLRPADHVLPEIIEADDIFDRLACGRGQPQFLGELPLLLARIVDAEHRQRHPVGVVVVEHLELAISGDRGDRLAAKFGVDLDRRAAGLLMIEIVAVDRHLAVERAELLIGERSEEHTSELQSLMRLSYAVFCLKKQNKNITASCYCLL